METVVARWMSPATDLPAGSSAQRTAWVETEGLRAALRDAPEELRRSGLE